MKFPDGILLIHKPVGITSFAVIERLQNLLKSIYGLKRKELPKMGHGGTLDPFATGLLVVAIGDAAKLTRYFLNSDKTYRGTIRFGETTIPGDPTEPISERTENLPESIQNLKNLAELLTKQDYLQTPPMHSAKKKDGVPLYELAREGIEIDRPSVRCKLYEFNILTYNKPRADFILKCSHGTYVRTLTQDFARLLGSVALLESLERIGSAHFHLSQALALEDIEIETQNKTPWDKLPNWIPFDLVLDHFQKIEVSESEELQIVQGKQKVLLEILSRVPFMMHEKIAFMRNGRLIAVAGKENQVWLLERVFIRESSQHVDSPSGLYGQPDPSMRQIENHPIL